MTLSEIQGALRGAELKDILVSGFIEKDERPVRFHALWRAVYFECDGALLKVAVIGDSGRIRLDVVHEVSYEAELEDGMLPALSSVCLQVLRDPYGSNNIASIRLWDLDDSSKGIECAAARLDLANGQQIFVDPLNYFGIKLGGHEQEEAWEKSTHESWRESVVVVSNE